MLDRGLVLDLEEESKLTMSTPEAREFSRRELFTLLRLVSMGAVAAGLYDIYARYLQPDTWLPNMPETDLDTLEVMTRIRLNSGMNFDLLVPQTDDGSRIIRQIPMMDSRRLGVVSKGDLGLGRFNPSDPELRGWDIGEIYNVTVAPKLQVVTMLPDADKKRIVMIIKNPYTPGSSRRRKADTSFLGLILGADKVNEMLDLSDDLDIDPQLARILTSMSQKMVEGDPFDGTLAFFDIKLPATSALVINAGNRDLIDNHVENGRPVADAFFKLGCIKSRGSVELSGANGENVSITEGSRVEICQFLALDGRIMAKVVIGNASSLERRAYLVPLTNLWIEPKKEPSSEQSTSSLDDLYKDQCLPTPEPTLPNPTPNMPQIPTATPMEITQPTASQPNAPSVIFEVNAFGPVRSGTNSRKKDRYGDITMWPWVTAVVAIFSTAALIVKKISDRAGIVFPRVINSKPGSNDRRDDDESFW